MEITQELLNRLNENSMYTSVGIRLEQAAHGAAQGRLEPNPKLCWPFPGQPHGGILFTLMDTTTAWAVLSVLDTGFNCTTVNLEIQYTSPAKGGLFICSARTTHRTGRLCFARAEIHDAENSIVALGQSTFRIIKTDVII